MRTSIEEALEGCGDEAADELGVLLDEVGMDDDAVAHRGHAAIGVPQDTRLLVAADLDARHIALRIAGDGGNLPGDQCRRAAGGIDIDNANLAGIEAAALHEGGPLLKLGCSRGYGNGLSLEVFRRPDVRFIEDHDCGRIAPEDAGDHPDAHPLRHAGPDDKSIREAELRRLAGNELGSASRPLAGADLDIEPGLLVEAFVLRDQETRIRPLVEPVEAHGHLPPGLRAPGSRKRERRKTGGNPGLAQELSSRWRFVVHCVVSCMNLPSMNLW